MKLENNQIKALHAKMKKHYKGNVAPTMLPEMKKVGLRPSKQEVTRFFACRTVKHHDLYLKVIEKLIRRAEEASALIKKLTT